MEALRRTHAKHKISPRPTKAAPRTTQLASKSLKISFGPTAASIDVLARDAYKNNVNMPRKTIDAISPWFLAAEELGEYIGIRFGRVPAGSAEPEWFFLRHTDYDGIGGLAELLRRRGAKVDNLLQIKYPAPPSWLPLLRALPKYLRPRKRVKWAVLERGIGGTDQPPQPAPAVAEVADFRREHDHPDSTGLSKSRRHGQLLPAQAPYQGHPPVASGSVFFRALDDPGQPAW
jgi:hypothetical protein